MSIKAIDWAKSVKAGGAGAKLALLLLADHMNEKTNECFPSIPTLAIEMECSENTVRSALKKLRERGLVTWVRRGNGETVERTDYVLSIGGGEALQRPPSKIEPPSNSEGEGVQILNPPPSNFEGPPLQILNPKQEVETGNETGRLNSKAHASRSLPVAPPPPGFDDEAEAEWNDLTARAALEADSMREDVFSPDAQTPIENIEILNATASDSIFGTNTPTKDQNAAERKSEAISKPKRRKRVALTLTELPIDWRIYCEKTAPELDPDRVWDDFSDFWQNRAKDPLCVDWSRAWQNNIRKLHALPNNDFRKAPQLKQEIAKAPPKPSRFMTAQERYEAELDRLGQISDEEYFARIKRAGEEFVRRDQERAARLAQEKAKKEKNQ